MFIILFLSLIFAACLCWSCCFGHLAFFLRRPVLPEVAEFISGNVADDVTVQDGSSVVGASEALIKTLVICSVCSLSFSPGVLSCSMFTVGVLYLICYLTMCNILSRLYSQHSINMRDHSHLTHYCRPLKKFKIMVKN